MSPHNKKIEIPRSNPQYSIDESKIVSNLYSISSTHWVHNGYGYPPGMGMGKDSHRRETIIQLDDVHRRETIIQLNSQFLHPFFKDIFNNI
jgi:hypothetical protein